MSIEQVSRDKLPDVGTPYEGEGGSVQDAYEFILQNFCEANRLWCRMQNQVRPRGLCGGIV
jgi:vacuolar protein sorting-associated protein 35